MDLEKQLDKNYSDIKEIFHSLSDIERKLDVFNATQYKVNLDFEKSIFEIKNLVEIHTDQLTILYQKKSLSEFINMNWWKIIALMIPILLSSGELMVHLRNLIH